MAKRQIEELKSELKSAKSIQIQQSKALTQLTNESEFPLKVKSLQEELRVAKDKNVKLTHHSTTVERNSKMQQELMIKLEHQIREMREQL